MKHHVFYGFMLAIFLLMMTLGAILLYRAWSAEGIRFFLARAVLRA